MVGNDAAPEFSAKVLPAGSAPADRTFKPNPVNEIPGQADNADSSETTSASDTLGGATSADVHTGLGHPGSGMGSAEERHDGKTKRARDNQGLQGKAEGGSGLTGDANAEAASLLKDHKSGHQTENEHNVSLDGAESKEPVGAEQVASMGQEERKRDYDRSSYTAQGGPNA